ncbi:unnamed protein product [Paramecium octaurelia]|uniref:Uncharacterized protein n=1 Tax=Paramecium octaurelia TaxID=43137 RepID=A0A8S1WPN7_PAROT|nr:unnamed protein product [Paramecium octaurelia]
MTDNLITAPYFSSKKKFFYKNLLDENSKVDFISQYRMIQKMKDSGQPPQAQEYTHRNEYKPLFTFGSPKHSLEQITTKQSTHLTTTQRVIPNTIASFDREESLPTISRKKRSNIKKIKMITQAQQDLQILDYLEYVKQTQLQKKQLNNIFEKLDEKEGDTFVSLNQLKQNHLKSIKAEQNLYIHKLIFSSFAVYSIKVLKQITIQEIIDLYLAAQKIQTSQFSSVEQIVQSFLSDLEIASRIYNSTKLMASALCKITGIDYKLFYLLYKPKRILPNSEGYVIDENFANNYQYTHIDCYDVYYRIFGAGDLPYEYLEHMKDFYAQEAPTTMFNNQIRQKDYKLAKQKLENDFGRDKTGWYNNANKIEVDLDFIRKLLYYQKNLQISLKNKQQDIIINKQLQLQHYTKQVITEQPEEQKQRQMMQQTNSLLYKIETVENQIGTFPLVSRANRYFYENLHYLERIQNKIKKNDYQIQ